MQFSFLLVVLAALWASAAAVALQPRASDKPSCYECPLDDAKGGALKRGHSDGLECVYKVKKQDRRSQDQRDDNTHVCKYSSQTGLIIEKADTDNCPEHAHSTNCSDKRNVKDAYERDRRRRAAAPAPSVPDYMRTRSVLRKLD